jgi:hypothetical protein
VRRDPADRSTCLRALCLMTPKDHRASPLQASQPSELINTDQSPRSFASEEARRAVKDQLRAPGNAFASTSRHRSAPKSLPMTRAVTPADPMQPANHMDATSRPRRDGRRPQRSRWPREDTVPNVRATSRLRRAPRRGAERSERPRLSLFPTPGRSLEPEGPRSRQGCRVQTRGVLL